MHMSEPHFDILIVGQGLAGSALAWMLIGAGQRVCVIDDDHVGASSAVAAGLINPLAGMRFNRRPELDDWLSAADRWYAELEAGLGQRYFHPLPMLRLFRSAEQRRFHARRILEPEAHALLGQSFESGRTPEAVAAPHGGFIQRRTGYVDLPLLLSGVRDWLSRRGSLRSQKLEYGQIAVSRDGVTAGELRARRLIFCDGARMRFNPWFAELPLAPEKGEILDLRLDGWRPRHIINGAHWLVPLENGQVRFGATHEHRQIDEVPTAAARQQLLAGLRALLPAAQGAQLIRQQAGIRPGTSDRYPLLGHHPEYPGLWIFNGFGARGALTIPWYAQRLTAHLTAAAPLPREADIRRFA